MHHKFGRSGGGAGANGQSRGDMRAVTAQCNCSATHSSSGSESRQCELLASCAGGADHTVQLLDHKSGVLAASLTGHTKRVTSLAFPNATSLLSASSDRTVKLWTVASGDAAAASEASAWRLVAPAVGDAAAPVAAVAAHPVDTLAISAASDATWQLLDLPAARRVAGGGAPAAGAFLSAAIHPDGNFFAAGGEHGGLYVYSVKTAEALMTISEGVAGGVRGVAFNENGFWVALACATSVQVRP